MAGSGPVPGRVRAAGLAGTGRRTAVRWAGRLPREAADRHREQQTAAAGRQSGAAGAEKGTAPVGIPAVRGAEAAAAAAESQAAGRVAVEEGVWAPATGWIFRGALPDQNSDSMLPPQCAGALRNLE
ncbi:hypothetical protein GCM10009771_10190 [Nesterenkonia flava]